MSIPAIDVERARRETPGCSEVLHLNNAGAGLMPQPVLDAQIDHLRLEARVGGYEAAALAQEAIDGTYDAIARLIGCGRDEVALVENATVAWDLAFNALSFAPGDRILTAEAEYVSNYIAYLKCARETGAVVEVVPSDDSGALSVDALESMIDERVKLIAVTHVPTNGGLVNPAEAIGRVAREADVPFLLDACQSVGQLGVEVSRIGCDFLSVTGRKYLRGPRGSGFLYVRRERLQGLEPPFVDLRGATWTAPDRYELRADARRFESWEFNYAAVTGLGAAVDYALGWGMDAIEARVTHLAETLRDRLQGIAGVRVRDLGRRRCGIVTFTLEGRGADEIKARLGEQKINVSVSRRTSTRIDMTRRRLNEVVRASVHYYNSEEELDCFCAALEKM